MDDAKNLAGKPIRCNAAICREPGTPLVMEEIMVAPPMQHEIRIRIICTSLCHSDIKYWKLKEFPAIFLRILGHEAVGIVESIGDDVHEVSEGDIVIPMFLSDCGDCQDCLSKKSNLCSKLPSHISPYMPRNKTSRFTDSKGEILYHFMFVSSFSEDTVVDIAHVTKIDYTIPPNKACLICCGVSAGVGAAWKTAQVDTGSTVVIFGLGTIGLAVINEMTGGGAEYCFECVGMTPLVEEAYACCRKGWGKTIVFGVDRSGAKLSFGPSEFFLSGKSFMGSVFGGLKAKSDVPVLLKHYQDKPLFPVSGATVDKFVIHEVNFEEINKAFELLLEGKSLRCVIWMSK